MIVVVSLIISMEFAFNCQKVLTLDDSSGITKNKKQIVLSLLYQELYILICTVSP
jgi:hypothetical protein